jgi:hypothetical protein
MGVSIHYWAIPPEGRLFSRLSNEKPFAFLMANLFHFGRGIFYFFDENELEEREEILDNVVGQDPEDRRWLDDFRRELDQTRLAYPGIERRTATLEKTSRLLEKRLVRELQRSRGTDAEAFVRSLMFGDRVFGREMSLSNDEMLGLVSAHLVQQGAKVLGQLDPESLFVKDGGWEDYHLHSFIHWRQLYFDAARGGEVLFVGVC